VIAEQGEGAVLAGEVDDFATVGAAVDQITEQNQAIVAAERELLEQLGKFLMAAVNVADGDDASVHARAANLLASASSGSKQERTWN